MYMQNIGLNRKCHVKYGAFLKMNSQYIGHCLFNGLYKT